MLYLGIDQHKRHLTVNLRSEDGSVILKRQVSTQWEKVRAFFADRANGDILLFRRPRYHFYPQASRREGPAPTRGPERRD